MKILLDENKYIVGYATIGDIEGSIECDVELPEDISEKIGFYKIEENEFIFDEDKYSAFKLEEEQRRAYEEELSMQQSIMSKFTRNAMLMTLSDEAAYNVRYMFDEWLNNYSYKKGTKVNFNQKFYKCLQNHVSQEDWNPSVATSLWVEISDPQIEFPNWKQPTGSHDAYSKGDKVSFFNNKYVSNVDDNVWKPTDYGWSNIS